jgi:L-cysteine:1D-myo-inositol 2-amino-2-deoxy-alpha-D-glucopyranoside ligase
MGHSFACLARGAGPQRRDNLAIMDAWRGAEVPGLPGRGVEPRVRDTATGELTVAATGHTASLYACGITPYDATHIGHAATFTAWDLLVRAWLDAGHEVVYVQNVTDVDDPLLERAARDGDDWRELALRETQGYRRDMEALRVLPPTHLVGAVEALPVIEVFAERLAARGALYDLDGDVYFARGTDALFGSLAGPATPTGLSVAEMAELFAERGGDPDRPGKKDPLDALVWRAERPGEPAWASRFGRGRPGWHVECAAIATEYLGTAFDVQAGGSDLVFPHHELSASHTRVACGSPAPGAAVHLFARVYAHSGLVFYQGAKMSKSLGNLVFVSRLRESGVDPMAIRLALLAHHYRSEWEWTDEVLADAEARLSRWRAATSAPAPTAPSPHSPTAAQPTAPATTPVPGAPAAAMVPPPPPATPVSGIPAPEIVLPPPLGAPDSGSPAAGIVSPPPLAAPDSGGPAAGIVSPPPLAAPDSGAPAAAMVLQQVRERLADDLDAPGALAAIDAWADAVLSAPPASPAQEAALIRATANALLGIAL